jgi:hypothetical protein
MLFKKDDGGLVLGIAEGRHEGRHTLNIGGLRRILAFFDECLAVFEESQILKSGGLRRSCSLVILTPKERTSHAARIKTRRTSRRP